MLARENPNMSTSQKFSITFDTRPISPRSKVSSSPRSKRQPERRDTSLEEREAMRRLRQRKRFPKSSSSGHDSVEDQVVAGSSRRKVLTPVSDSPTRRLPTISDGERLAAAASNSIEKRDVTKKLRARRRSPGRGPKQSAPGSGEPSLILPKLDDFEESIVSMDSPPVFNAATVTRKKRVSLPALSEDSPLSNNSLSTNPSFSQGAAGASKYSYAKNFLLGKRTPEPGRRQRAVAGDSEEEMRKRHPKTSITDELQDGIREIFDDAHIPKGMRRSAIPRLCKFVSDREAHLKSKITESQVRVNELERELESLREKLAPNKEITSTKSRRNIRKHAPTGV